MADVRLIAILLVACADAGAQPPPASNIKPPAGWTAQPALVTAAKDALGKTKIDGLEAFGEPAMGCYSVWMAVRGTGSATDLAEQLVRGLTEPDKKKAPKRKVDIKDVVKPTAEEGVLALTFESAPYKGRLRARLGKGRITALACWSAQREPVACEQACTTILVALP
ncbi:MAG: hypothetical protein M4D80_22185 [Myxococcota bacterium]|nr:hypothetical protein [Myxococcota bacterium]